MRVFIVWLAIYQVQAVRFIGKVYTAPPISSWRGPPTKASDQSKSQIKSKAREESHSRAQKAKEVKSQAVKPHTRPVESTIKPTTTASPILSSSASTSTKVTSFSTTTTHNTLPVPQSSTNKPSGGSSRTDDSGKHAEPVAAPKTSFSSSGTTTAAPPASSTTASPGVNGSTAKPQEEAPPVVVTSPTTAPGKSLEEKLDKVNSADDAQKILLGDAQAELEAAQNERIAATAEPTILSEKTDQKPTSTENAENTDTNIKALDQRLTALEKTLSTNGDLKAKVADSHLTAIDSQSRESAALGARKAAESDEGFAKKSMKGAEQRYHAAKQSGSAEAIHNAEAELEIAKENLTEIGAAKTAAKVADEDAEIEGASSAKAMADQDKASALEKKARAKFDKSEAEAEGDEIKIAEAKQDLADADKEIALAEASRAEVEKAEKERKKEDAAEMKRLKKEERAEEKKQEKAEKAQEKKLAKKEKAEEKKQAKKEKHEEKKQEKKEKAEEKKQEKKEKAVEKKEKKALKKEREEEKRLEKFLRKHSGESHEAKDDHPSAEASAIVHDAAATKESTATVLELLGGLSQDVINHVADAEADREKVLDTSEHLRSDIAATHSEEQACPLVRKSLTRTRGESARAGALLPGDDDPIRQQTSSTATDLE